MPSSPRKAAPAPAEGFRKLLVAADGSEPALRAVDVAAEMAARYGAALHVLLVVEAPPPPDPGLEAEALALEAVAGRQREAHSRWIVDAAMAHQVRPEIHDLGSQSVQTVVAFARDNEIDLLVVSGAKHGSLFDAVYEEMREALLGSRAGHIVHLAPCTVLVVK
jgi:nucleotide-binding universal stress UspA family protein